MTIPIGASTPPVETGTSWYVSVFLVVNAALGAGLLNFPHAFHAAGTRRYMRKWAVSAELTCSDSVAPALIIILISGPCVSIVPPQAAWYLRFPSK